MGIESDLVEWMQPNQLRLMLTAQIEQDIISAHNMDSLLHGEAFIEVNKER